jgi:hypothetical protein
MLTWAALCSEHAGSKCGMSSAVLVAAGSGKLAEALACECMLEVLQQPPVSERQMCQCKTKCSAVCMDGCRLSSLCDWFEQGAATIFSARGVTFSAGFGRVSRPQAPSCLGGMAPAFWSGQHRAMWSCTVPQARRCTGLPTEMHMHAEQTIQPHVSVKPVLSSVHF